MGGETEKTQPAAKAVDAPAPVDTPKSVDAAKEQLKSPEQIKEETQSELQEIKSANETENIIGKLASIFTNEDFKKAFKEEKFGECLMIAIKIFFGDSLDKSAEKQQEIEKEQAARLPEFETLLTKLKSEQKIPAKITVSVTDIGLLKGKNIQTADDLANFLKKFDENDRQKLEKNGQYQNELEKGISIYRYLALLERSHDQKLPDAASQSTAESPAAGAVETAAPTSTSPAEATDSAETNQNLLLDAPKSTIDLETGQCCNFEVKGHPPVTIKHDRIEIAGKGFHVEAKVKKFGFESFIRVGIKKITPTGDNFDVTMGAFGQSESKTLTPDHIKKLISTFDINKEKSQFDYKVQSGSEEKHFKLIAT